MASNEQRTYISGFLIQSTKKRNHDGLASYTQNIHNLNMATSSKPLLCDVMCLYCKVALPAVKNPEEVEISVRAYVLSI